MLALSPSGELTLVELGDLREPRTFKGLLKRLSPSYVVMASEDYNAKDDHFLIRDAGAASIYVGEFDPTFALGMMSSPLEDVDNGDILPRKMQRLFNLPRPVPSDISAAMALAWFIADRMGNERGLKVTTKGESVEAVRQ
jgi:hypothetical protein